MSENWSFETKQIHAGQTPDPTTGARALPIYQTTSYQFRDTQHAADLFGLAEPGNIYTRIMNPTQGVVEERLAALEGGVGALLVASGQAATTGALTNVAEAGDHIVASASLYGGTDSLLRHTFPKLGIQVTFVEDNNDPAAWRAAVQDNTKVFFGETIGNPKGDILDLEAISAVAKEVGVPFIVDNTVATPYLLNPLKHGADTVVHSATKYIGGHGTAIAGVVIDGGTFDYAAHGDKFPGFTTPDASYHGLVFAEALGPAAYITKLRVQYLRNVGPAVAPFNAFLIAQGLETLSLRIERHIENTRKVAEWLQAREDVAKVTWASLDGNPYKELADKYTPRGSGAVLTFELPGGIDAGRRFIDALELFSHVANIGDVRSLAIHPASTTHSQGTPEEHAATGVTPGLVRLAIGIEGIDDILADLDAGFRAAK
ncbi:bifunctional o-acetylhomoserine/o-acetylserine sulfhydrylase [Aeromicrobium duanguangcaii]|uniref:Bifunctional o-acetylhomoserine/o-acetylserine sulfhydrylase n=1 Tax=Aeromicrobium duanguangcaii TaxID=2968086 RepID=A0ABY5KD43_9ACTN|nr:bifunctional o-acetylhomoserine/o-acetylserine sulfhydrylase [Aeromicrobium duanguangcaii]MCD9154562.1 bifunctional o-acetylhomoserine/o-acetylserine sulfhydrylase [Aeromicrobium duanguangcaii]MCL3838314.1 bifunctional o-acetylhomoserine/o-acetylserine sulfhydrylase [Aeromicrobium duanguangcaii]UUI68382.1 bifunctional o-acetylhomoserine/o-acetylserine sulfhydrylase [Aeromicrobium duanguangcaii]